MLHTQLENARLEILLLNVNEIYPPHKKFGGSLVYRVCSKERPMPLDLAYVDRWEHPMDMVHEIECGSDYYARYKCDACGHEWESELPE